LMDGLSAGRSPPRR